MYVEITHSVVWCPYLAWITPVYLYSSSTSSIHRIYNQTINSDHACFHDWGFGTMDLRLYLKLVEWIATLKSATPLKLNYCISWAKFFSLCEPVKQVYHCGSFRWWLVFLVNNAIASVCLHRAWGTGGSLTKHCCWWFFLCPLTEHCKFNIKVCTGSMYCARNLCTLTGSRIMCWDNILGLKYFLLSSFSLILFLLLWLFPSIKMSEKGVSRHC